MKSLFPFAGISFAIILFSIPTVSQGFIISSRYSFSGTVISQQPAGSEFPNTGEHFRGMFEYRYDSDWKYDADIVSSAGFDYQMYFDNDLYFDHSGQPCTYFSITDNSLTFMDDLTEPHCSNPDISGPMLGRPLSFQIKFVESYPIFINDKLRESLDTSRIASILMPPFSLYNMRTENLYDYQCRIDTFVPVAPVPEPSTIILLLSGIIGLTGFIKKIKS